MSTILITGGAGFIGSHISLALLEDNFNIVIIDSFINSYPKSIERVKEICNLNKINVDGRLKIYKGDLRDEVLLNKIFLEQKNIKEPIIGVIHLAGLKAAGESVENPLLYWDTNFLCSINLLKVMDANNCRTIVFSSSAMIYASSPSSVKENDPIKPINPYGNTKFTIEMLLNDLYLSTSREWKIINLRYFNPIGAHYSGLIGESPKQFSMNLFPTILNVASGNLTQVEICGKDWDTKDGTGVRDYIHVMDLAEGHLYALNYLLLNNAQIKSINLGTGKGTTVLELINCFQEVNNIKVPYVFSQRRKGDSATFLAANDLALSLFNWKPSRSIKEMCIDGWNWKIKNPKGY